MLCSELKKVTKSVLDEKGQRLPPGEVDSDPLVQKVRTPAVGSVLGACASGVDSGRAWFDGGMFSTLYENRTNTHYMYVCTILLLNRMCYGREEC